MATAMKRMTAEFGDIVPVGDGRRIFQAHCRKVSDVHLNCDSLL